MFFFVSFVCLFFLVNSADSHTQHSRPAFVHRDDRTSKTYERLQKKLKDRQAGSGGGQVKDSPPPSPQKTCGSLSAPDVHNGVGGKGPEAELPAGHVLDKQAGRGKNAEAEGQWVKDTGNTKYRTYTLYFLLKKKKKLKVEVLIQFK